MPSSQCVKRFETIPSRLSFHVVRFVPESRQELNIYTKWHSTAQDSIMSHVSCDKYDHIYVLFYLFKSSNAELKFTYFIYHT